MVYFAAMRAALIIGSVMVLITAVAFINSKPAVPEKHVEVVLRQIGHELLLTAGDSTSRVLPVRKSKENSYQISFQKELGFVSDSLIRVVHRTFQANPIARNYIVNLKGCEHNATILAFEMNGETGDLSPCKGRRLEVGCYVIDIELIPEPGFNYAWLLLLLIPAGLAGYSIRLMAEKKKVPRVVTDQADYTPLGKFLFYAANNLLKNGPATITLSEKESRALDIFVRNLNQVVEREKLMKELWEDEGTVVISRNVDVLVSKLRKKLADDDNLKLINVHGRGYKLIWEP